MHRFIPVNPVTCQKEQLVPPTSQAACLSKNCPYLNSYRSKRDQAILAHDCDITHERWLHGKGHDCDLPSTSKKNYIQVNPNTCRVDMLNMKLGYCPFLERVEQTSNDSQPLLKRCLITGETWFCRDEKREVHECPLATKKDLSPNKGNRDRYTILKNTPIKNTPIRTKGDPQ